MAQELTICSYSLKKNPINPHFVIYTSVALFVNEFVMT